jgi:hypothetical protein
MAQNDNNVTNDADINVTDTDVSGGEGSNAIKDPHDWATGEEPMTGAQKSYLKTLSDQAGEELDETLTKAAASLKIEELQQKTGRGTTQS